MTFSPNRLPFNDQAPTPAPIAQPTLVEAKTRAVRRPRNEKFRDLAGELHDGRLTFTEFARLMSRGEV